MKSFLFYKSNTPLILFSLFILKQLLFRPDFPDAIISLGLIGLYAYSFYVEENKAPDVNQEFKKELSALKDNVKSNKDNLEALKLSATFRR